MEETTTPATVAPVPRKRRRAVQACLSCRSRKVRCNVARSGPPCMNCSLDGIDCLVKDRKPKSRTRHLHGKKSTGHDEQHPSAHANTTGLDATCLGALDGSQSAGQGATLEAGQGTIEQLEEQVMDLMFLQDADAPAAGEQPSSLSFGATEFLDPGAFMPQDDCMAQCIPEHDTARASNRSVQAPCTSQRRPTHKNSVFYTYYPFITLDNLYNCSPHDVGFLEAEGCFHLPTRPIMDQIVRQYFLHVHPLLPLLNEGDFWDMYHSNWKPSEGSAGISLLVVQAMMFVSCNFVNWSPESTRKFGYKNTRGLRATFYRRAKLLYDFGAESSSLAIAQSALLLSYWTPPAGTQLRSNTVWLGIAIECAKNAGAPYSATLPAAYPTSLRSAHHNLRKRLWWCCIIRDRILPLGLRRGIQITRAHFDFTRHAPLGRLDLADEVHRSRVYDAAAKRELLQVLAHVLDLCVVLTDVLVLVFPLDGCAAAAEAEAEAEAAIRAGKKALVHWYAAAVTASATAGDGGAEIDWNKHDSVVLYTHLMFTYYHSARMALYNHELQHHLLPMADNSSPPIDTQKLRETRDAIQNACSNIAENIRGLNQRRLTRWLPISAAAYVAFPLALDVLNNHLSAAPAPAPTAAPHSSRALIEVMMTLHAQYDGVHWIAKLVRHLVALVQHDAARVSNWAELLILQPRTYLRLALAMDVSMSSGCVPEQQAHDEEFPPAVRSRLAPELEVLRALEESPEGMVVREEEEAEEDSALGADFFHVTTPPRREEADQKSEHVSSRGLDGDCSAERQSVLEEQRVSRLCDHSPQQGKGSAEEGGFGDGTGRFADDGDGLFDAVLALAEMTSMGDGGGRPDGSLTGAGGMDTDYDGAALSV